MVPRLPRAILWDLDGTLVDSQPYWAASQFDIAARHGAAWSDAHSLQLVGLDLLDAGRYVRTHMQINLSPAEIVEEMLDGVVARVERAVPWRLGARELLMAAQREDLPCALVTMSYRRFADPVLSRLPAGIFDALITGDEVARGKPHPDPYLTAARELGLEPGDCLAIEDSETGVRSASAAGCTVLVAPSHGPVSPGPRRTLVESLGQVTVADLRALMATDACHRL